MALLTGGNSGVIGSNFNAQDPSTWYVDFGRKLSQDEINYYAPQMQARYDTELRRQENVGRSNIVATPTTTANGGNVYGGQAQNSTRPYEVTNGGSPQEAVGGSMVSGPSTGGASMSGQNPYLQQMGDALTSTMTNNWRRNVQPQIASSAMATGGYGGSRQGVIEANAMNDLNGQIGGALTNLYGQGFNTALNYDLGLRGNDLGFAGLDAQINQNNFNNRLQGANFGLGVWNQGMQNNQTGINAGSNIHNTPMNNASNFAGQYNSIGQGFATATGSSNQQGNPLMGMLGGAQIGSRIGNMWGGGTAGSAGDTATGQNFWATNFSGGMGD